MKQLMIEKNLGLYMIVTTHLEESGNYEKEVLLYQNSSVFDVKLNMFHELREYLNNDEQYDLKINKTIENENECLITWNVGNLKKDRKYLEKVLTKFYNEN